MITLDPKQEQIASRSTAMMVTLVKLDTFASYVNEIIDETFYLSTLPLRYQWDGSTTNTFRGVLKSVLPISRGFPHIPDPNVLTTRDSMGIVFDATKWSGEFPWNRFTDKNLIGARIEVASLLLDLGTPRPDDWQDQSSLGAVHVVRFRGEVTDTPEYDDEGNQFGLTCESLEPIISWPIASDETEVSERDFGKLYPIPIGRPKRVPLVQRQVGWITTILNAMSQTQQGTVFVTDTAGLPAAGEFALWIGSERISATVTGPFSINIVQRATNLGGLPTTARIHNAGSVLIEEIDVARYVFSGVASLGMQQLYARSPHTNELVLIPTSLYGFATQDETLDPGEKLGVVSFTPFLWGQVIRKLNNEANIAMQPVFAQSSSIRTEIAARTGEFTPAVNFQATHTIVTLLDGGINPQLVSSFSSSAIGANSAACFYWLNTDITSDTEVVERFRLLLDYTISNGNDAFNFIQFRARGGFLGLASETVLHYANVAGNTTTQSRSEISDWFTVPAGTTMADMRNGATFSANSPLINFFIEFNGTGAIQMNIDQADFTVEVEIGGSIMQTQLAVADGAQEIGFNLDLFADVLGAVNTGTVTSLVNFDKIDQTNNDWVGVNCSLSDIAGPFFGIQSLSPTPGTAITRTMALLSMNPAINLSAAPRLRFEYKLNPGTWDGMDNGWTAFQIQILSGANIFVRWTWPKSVLHGDDAWHQFTLDPFGSGPQFHSIAGTLNYSNIIQINIDWNMRGASFGGAFSIRNLRTEARTFPEHPIDVAEWLIEDQAGQTADTGTFATAKTNLPSVKVSGVIETLGASFGTVLARLGHEARTNFVPSEGASGTVYKAFNALSTYAFAASTKMLGEFRGLRTKTKILDEQPTEFVGLYNHRSDFPADSTEGFRSLIQANASTNDISADVPTLDITNAQDRVGVRPSDPIGFMYLPDSVSAIEVFAYYVHESLRGDARRYSMRVPYSVGYALESGDIIQFTPRWKTSAVKCRIVRTTFSFDEPSIGLNLEEVL